MQFFFRCSIIIFKKGIRAAFFGREKINFSGYDMKNWLLDKYVVLTGASGGIGAKLAILLIKKYGANVIGIGRTEEKLRFVQAELGDDEKKFSYRVFDVGDQSAWEAFADDLAKEEIKPILLINNAGAFPTFARVQDTSVQTVEEIMRINFFSAVYSYSAIGKNIEESGGIVNVCSSSALCPIVGTAAYSASKSAMKGYTEALLMEKKGRRYVGIVYPGTTATDLFRNDENTKNSALDIIAMKPEKMAKKIAKVIIKRKKRAVLGMDAKCMNLLAKIAPVKGLALIAWVMKKSGSKVFTEVFKEEKKK